MRNLSKIKIASLAVLGFLSLINIGCILDSQDDTSDSNSKKQEPRGFIVTFNSNSGSPVAPCTGGCPISKHNFL